MEEVADPKAEGHSGQRMEGGHGPLRGPEVWQDKEAGLCSAGCRAEQETIVGSEHLGRVFSAMIPAQRLHKSPGKPDW